MDSILEMWETAPSGEQMQKALDAAKQEQKKSAEPKSAIIDPGNMYGVGGTRSKQAIVPFGMLRSMAKIPAVAAILLTRKNQVARFARRPRFDGDVGFRVGLKDIRAKMTEAQAKRAHEIEEFFLKTGAVKNRKRKDNFNTFLRKITDDSLTLDAMTFELVPFEFQDGLAEMWATDAATIELVANAPMGESAQPIVYEPMTKRGAKIKDNDVAYVQRLNGKIEAEFTEEELAYAIRNPRTDLNTVDFGMSELEVLIEIVTGILNGTRYNTTYFTHSHLPQGVLEMVGKYQQADLDNFKRHWKQLTSGASGKWAVPVMALQEGQGFKFTPFKNSNKDMEFSTFMEFLFNIACAVYQIDPNEVGFKSWTSNTGMSQSDNTEAKMEKSVDKGFIPLMNFLSDTFNFEIVDQIDEEFAFYWVGVDEEDEDRKLERQKTQVDMGAKTIAMIWAENDVDVDEIKKQNGGELPKWANAPANATLIQVYMAETGLGQQGQPGDPNDPNAEADAEQAQADDQHGKAQEMADDGHDKQLEVMDKQHDQNLEAKKVDHAHQLKMEQMKATNAKAVAKESGKDKPKASEGKKDDKPDPDDQHEKELEKMKLDHKHDMELEKQKQKGKPALKKSLDTSEDDLNISITWDEY